MNDKLRCEVPKGVLSGQHKVHLWLTTSPLPARSTVQSRLDTTLSLLLPSKKNKCLRHYSTVFGQVCGLKQ